MASFDFNLRPTDFSSPVRRAQREELELRARRNALADYEAGQRDRTQFENALATGGVNAAARVNPMAAQPLMEQQQAQRSQALQGVAAKAWGIYTAQSPLQAAQAAGALESMAEEVGKPVQALTDDDVRALARQDAYKAISAGGLDPRQFKEPEATSVGNLYQVDVNGTPTYLPAQQAMGKPAWKAPTKPSHGISFTTPDGSTINIGGDAQPFTLPKPAQTQAGEQYMNAVSGLTRLQGVVSRFKPEYLTVGGRVRGMWAGIKAQVPEVLGKLSEQDRQYLTDFSAFKSDTLDNVNNYIKEMTGAAMGVQEAQRIMETMPNIDDDPVSFQAKLSASMRRLSLVAARSTYLLQNPTLNMEQVSLDRMQSIIESRANDLYSGYLRSGIEAKEARKRALMEARTQFGLAGDG